MDREMITVRVDDSFLVGAMLQFIVGVIDTEQGLDQLLQQGCSADLLDNLRQRKARDLREVAPGLRSVQITISAADLDGALHRIDRVRQDQELFEYFVLNGASRGMICELWKKTHEEVTAMRKTLLPDGSGNPGRAPLPKDPTVREAIHRAWHALEADADLSQRERIFQLHQQFPDFLIDSLVSTLSEFDGPDRPRARRSGAKSAPIDVSPRGPSSPFGLA